MRPYALLLALLFALTPTFAYAKKGGGSSKSSSSSKVVKVKGHVKKDGTYVAPHYRTKGNKTQTDNWSTKGNANPTTGKSGTKDAKK